MIPYKTLQQAYKDLPGNDFKFSKRHKTVWKSIGKEIKKMGYDNFVKQVNNIMMKKKNNKNQ